jgi:hypothetical protein
MKLDQNSISAKFYRWFYAESKYNMPSNLCPYFWKLIFMYVFLVPASVFYLPTTVLKMEYESIAERVAKNLMLWLALFVAFLALFPVTYFFVGWFPKKTTFEAWQILGLAIWIVAALIGITFGIIHLIKARQEKKRHKRREWIWDDNGDYIKNPDYVPYEKRPNLLIEFIKAKYKRYCPKIDWN